MGTKFTPAADTPRGRQNAPAASRKLRKREKSLRQRCGNSASTLDLTRMDITTVLGFFFQIREQIRTNEALRTAMAIVEVPADFYWSDAINSLNAEIDHYKQILARKGVSTGSGDSEVEGPSGGGSGLGGYDKD